jgi:hypothetical protein
MRAKVLPFDLLHTFALEDSLNEFLDRSGDIKISSVSSIVGDGSRSGVVVILYTEPAMFAKKQPTCSQCHKAQPLEGLKICEPCRDYQRDYRKKRKSEGKARYP